MLSAVFLLLLVVLCTGCRPPVDRLDVPEIDEGFIDLESITFSDGQLVELSGQWVLYPGVHLTPGELAADRHGVDPVPLQVPGEIIGDHDLGTGLNAWGGGTLRLRIRTDGTPDVYGLKLRYFAPAHELWINGTYRGSAGTVSLEREMFRAGYVPREVLFFDDTGEIDLVIPFANFHHRRIRFGEVLFGNGDAVARYAQKGIIREGMVFGALLVVAVYYAVLYRIRRGDRASLYLALVSLAAGLRGSVISERVLVRLLPVMPGEIMMKIGFFPVFILLPLLVLYVRELFGDSRLDRPARVSRHLIVGFTLFLLMAPVRIYDLVFQYGLVLIIGGAAYLIHIIFRIGMKNDVRGGLAMAAGAVVLLLAAINDMLREFTIIQSPEMLSLGVVAFILIQALFLAWRFSDAYNRAAALASQNEKMVGEIQNLNRNLERIVEDRTRQLREANRKLRILSRKDPLTGLANRGYLQERLEREWRRARRTGAPLSAIMCDIDHFKQYNDAAGHPQGDDVLGKVADVIRSAVRRPADLAARYGGEEFFVLLPDTDETGAVDVAESIRRGVKQLAIEHPHPDAGPVVTISLGVASVKDYPAGGEMGLVDLADQHLYEAKNRGRNQVVSG